MKPFHFKINMWSIKIWFPLVIIQNLENNDYFDSNTIQNFF